MTKLLMAVLVSFLSLAVSQVAFAFDLSDDTYGARDYEGVQRYPGSRIDQYREAGAVEYALVLGKLKRINGELAPEFQEQVRGQLTRITYQIPEGHDAAVAFRHFKKQLADARLLFECVGRECGSSSHWANQIFGIATLYGPEKEQHYAALNLTLDGQELLVTLYTIVRGNKRIYAHLDLIATSAQRAQELKANPETLLASLQQQGRLVLAGVKFDEKDQLLPSSERALTPYLTMLQKRVRMQLYVVGHLQESGAPLAQLKERALQRAQAVKEMLVAQGVAQERLVPQGVGPLSPGGKSDDANRIELVLVAP